MSTLDERADSTVEPQRAALGAILERQRQAFMSDGPASASVRRNRIDRLMALVVDNTDAFVDAMASDFGTRSKAATLFTEVIRHDLGHRAHEIPCCSMDAGNQAFACGTAVRPAR